MPLNRFNVAVDRGGKLVSLIVIFLSACSGSLRAQDRPHYYVRFNGIAGSVQTPLEYKEWILAEDFTFELYRPVDQIAGEVRRRSNPTISDFSLVAKADIAAPVLMEWMLSGQIFRSVSFDERAYFPFGPATTGSWSFTNAQLTEVSRISPFRNRYSFAFDEFSYRFTDYDTLGKETISEMNWDARSNESSVQTIEAAAVLSDVNHDLRFDGRDIDTMTQALAESAFNPMLDMNGDGRLGWNDREILIYELLGTVPGDTDVNWQVNFADFLNLSAHFGQPGGWAQGDFDGSGNVEFADFLSLSSNFAVALPANIERVPEPRVAIIDLMAWLTAIIFIHRRRLSIRI